MHTAIDDSDLIDGAQKRLLQRIHQEIPDKIPDVVVGFRGGQDNLPVFSNNRIWFAYKPLEKRHWNAFGSGPLAHQRSNSVTVEVNPAIHGVDRRVAGLFAVDKETKHTVLLHRGKIGGGRKGIGKASFMEWYRGTPVRFTDPSRGEHKEQAILVADLESSEFLIQLESFVDIVRKFKDSRNADDPTGMSDTDLRRKPAAAPTKPKSSTTISVVYKRNRDVAEWAKRRAKGRCELCRKPAPFTNASNEPYLESHHIDWLAHRGSDSIDNTVALCPNCHRKMHVVNAAEDIEKLKRRAGAG